LKSVLVTGAAGFIGGHLCQRLEELNVVRLVAVDSLRSGNWSRVPLSTKKINRDISSIPLESWIEMLSGVDVLFHLAAEKYNSSKSTPEKLITTNVSATERILRAAALAKVGRVVFTSSLYAYGSLGPEPMVETDVPKPNTLYGASKLMGEHILASTDRDLGLSWNCARLFFIYGPQQFADGGYKSVIISNFERIHRGERPVVFGDGLQKLDYVYVSDCVNALIGLATTHLDRTVANIASGTPVSVLDLTTLMLDITGSQLSPVFQDRDWTHGTSRWGSIELARESLGWSAATSLVEGLTSTHDWMLKSRLNDC
jgi:UDP-glucose 4-epimerase